jgi:serine/threonine-protein kinase
LFQEGEILAGRYRIERTLGQGGMGVVYEATHLKHGRVVAVKVIRTAQTNPHGMKRFEREARAMARARHPNVVDIFDIDQTDEGVMYMVMERLLGRHLREECKARAVNTGELITWTRQVLDALGTAHALGVVHRDLKPDNVFIVSAYNRSQFAKVLDFGISKVLDEQGVTTMTSQVLGTPKFIAPEVIRGERTDHRVDVFSVGVMLYHLLSAQWPFGRKEVMPYLASVARDEPVPMAHHRPDLPLGLLAVIARAIARTPEERFSTANEFREALLPFESSAADLAIGPPRSSGGTAEGWSTRPTSHRTPTWTETTPTPTPRTGRPMDDDTVTRFAPQRGRRAALILAGAIVGASALAGGVAARLRVAPKAASEPVIAEGPALDVATANTTESVTTSLGAASVAKRAEEPRAAATASAAVEPAHAPAHTAVTPPVIVRAPAAPASAAPSVKDSPAPKPTAPLFIE